MINKIKFILASLSSAFVLNAHAAPASDAMSLETKITIILVVFLLIISIALIIAISALNTILQKMEMNEAKKKGIAYERKSIFQMFWNKANSFDDSDPEAKLESAHVYDDIIELDNKLPPWWIALFYITIIFGAGYLALFFTSDGERTQLAEYQRENELFDAKFAALKADAGPSITEDNVVVLDDATALTSGEKIYKSKCLSCHGENLQGVVGPNLVDQYWKHGGDVASLFKVVKYGIQGTSMLAWDGKLEPVEMQEVVSFILSKQGTNPPNAKEPEGELYDPKAGQKKNDKVKGAETSNGKEEQVMEDTDIASL